jgi:hypothetical protein
VVRIHPVGYGNISYGSSVVEQSKVHPVIIVIYNSMVYYKQDFLPNNLLNYLQTYANSIIRHDLLETEQYYHYGILLKEGNVSEVFNRLGRIWALIIEEVKNQLEILIDEEMLIHMIRIQSMTDRYRVYPHYDGPVFNRPLTYSYTSLLYLNEYWEMNDGGLLQINDKDYIPNKNSLVVYSRDLLHGVTEAKTKWRNPRNVLLISWAIKNIKESLNGQ